MKESSYNQARKFNEITFGYTLIELLAILIILSAIALITTPIVLNVIEMAKMHAAEVSVTSYVKAIEDKIVSSSYDIEKYQDRDNYAYDEIDVDIKGKPPTDGSYSLKDGIVRNGTFCINDYVVDYENGESKVTDKGCVTAGAKLLGRVKLSNTSGIYTYPTGGTFEVVENISGGTLTCTSNNTNVATCSISGNTITVTPGTTKGTATLTIKSAATTSYKEGQATYVVTTKAGVLSVTATGYSGVYDGKTHGITVTSNGATIKYSTDNKTYSSTKPTYTNVGTYTVYYEVSKTGYTTVTGSKQVIISKASGSVVAPTAKTLTYTGSAQSLVNAGSSSTGTIQYKLEGGSYSTSIPTATNVGTYKVYYKVVGDSNHNDVAEASISVTIGKASNTLTLSSSSGNYTYPTSGTFTVTKNLSGGTLTCTSNNTNVATCSISGNTITVTPGTTKGTATLTIKSAATTSYKEGQATYVVTTKAGVLSVTATGYSGVYDGKTHGITVTSNGATIKYSTDNKTYSSTKPTYTNVGTYTVYYEVSKTGYTTVTGSKQVIISKASGSVVAPTAKTLTYTGSAQSLVNAGSSSTGTIQYKLEGGSYSTSIPTATNVGTYKVYYKVVGDSNHNDVAEASINITIGKGTNTLTLSANSGSYTYPTSGTFTVTKNTSGGTLSCSSSNTSIATCSVSGTTITVTPGSTEGNAILTIKSAETASYKEGSATYVATTKRELLSVTATGYTGVYDGLSHGITVTSSGATISYSTDNKTYSSTNPTYKNAGTYTVYYKVVKSGYQTVTGSKQVVISKADGYINLSETSGVVKIGASRQITTIKRSGAISCKSNDESIATCSISGTKLTVKGISSGTTTIQINSVEVINYKAASVTYTIEVLKSLSNIVKLGDYVTYVPTTTSYTPNATLTGCNGTTACGTIEPLNPSELTSWRVLKINNDGTIDIVSTNVSNQLIHFYGKTGFINYVKVLNEASIAYRNYTYASKTRAFGYNGQTQQITNTTKLTSTTAPWTYSYTSNDSNEAYGGGDIMYLDDINQMNLAGISLNASNKSGTDESYLIASRLYTYSHSDYLKSTNWTFSIRYITTINPTIIQQGSYAVPYQHSTDCENCTKINYSEGNFHVSGYFRPIVTLKSRIAVTGSGTASDPYVLN